MSEPSVPQTCGGMVPKRRGEQQWMARCRQPLRDGQRVCTSCEEDIVQASTVGAVTREDMAAAIVEAEAAPARERREADEVRRAKQTAARREAEARSVVYYVRLGTNHLKIGTTEHLRERMTALRVVNPDDLLAVEPGGYDLEQRRHAQFHRWRWTARREDFAEAPELLEHIAAVRSEHGDPWGSQ